MAEWQTRCVQVAVTSRSCRFNSYRRHQSFSLPFKSSALCRFVFIVSCVSVLKIKLDLEAVFRRNEENGFCPFRISGQRNRKAVRLKLFQNRQSGFLPEFFPVSMDQIQSFQTCADLIRNFIGCGTVGMKTVPTVFRAVAECSGWTHKMI